MSTDFVIVAEKRDDLGKGASRRLRHQEKTPGILYGSNQDPEPITVSHDLLIKSLQNEAFYSHILTVKIGGQECKAVLKDLQRHPYKPKILHIDLQRVDENTAIHMAVPLHFLGADVAPGVKLGGLLSHSMSELEVTCKPKDLPEYIEVDVSQLDTGDTLHISDLVLPAGVKSVDLSHGHDSPVATLQKLRGASSSEEDSEETAE